MPKCLRQTDGRTDEQLYRALHSLACGLEIKVKCDKQSIVLELLTKVCYATSVQSF